MRGFMLAAAMVAVAVSARADDPPRGKELTPDERKELEAKYKELEVAARRAYGAGRVDDTEKALRECLAVARRLNPNQDSPLIAESLNNLAVVLKARGKYADAESLYRDALDMRRRLYPKQDHPELARSLNNLAVVLKARGKYADAESLYRDALDMRRRLYPMQDHLELARSLNNLAAVLHDRGKYADAELLVREALEMRRRLYPKQDHPDLAASLNGLAVVLEARGKYAEAEPLHREALEMRRRLYPKQDHPDLAQSLRNLAGVLAVRDKYADAEPLFRDALEMYQRLYPKQDHPDLALSLSNLAAVLRDRGKYADAEPLYRDALEMYQRLYPKQDYPDLALSLSNLAFVLEARGKFGNAEPLYRDALEMNRRLYPNQDHPDLAASLNGLAIVLEARGKYADAEPLCRDALEMSRRLYPKQDHPDVARSLSNLAIVLSDRGKYADAEILIRDALDMRRRLYPKQDHPRLAASLDNLAIVLSDRGKYADAEPIARDALEMYRRLYPKQDHPDVAKSLSNLAIVLRVRGKYADAEPLARDALDMQQRLYPKQDHPDLATGLNNLAIVLEARGKYADAEPLYWDALEMDRRLYPKQDHPSLATRLNNLATVLEARGKYADAEPLYRDALEMYRRLYPKQDHPDLATSLGNLAVVLQARGKYADAEPLYRDALEMDRRLYPKQDHPDLAKSLSNLAFVLEARGQYADAETVYRDGLRMYDRLAITQASGGSEGDALTLAASQPLARDGFLSNARANRSDPASVYAAVWASKGAVSRVAERRAVAARAATDAKAAAVLADLQDARRRRAELLLAAIPTDPRTREARDFELAALARRIQDLDKTLRPLLPALDRLDKLAAATPDDLRKLLPRDAAVVDLIAYTHFEQDPEVPGKAGEKQTRNYAAFVVTRDAVRWLELGSAKEIDAAVRVWREAITTAPDREPAADLPRAVRDRVWAPVRMVLPEGVKVVYISPDAALTGVPWAALPGDKPGTVLLEEFTIAVVPHAPALLDALGPADPSRRRTAGLLAVGGVPYSDPPQRPTDDTALAQARPGTRGELPLDPKKEPLWKELAGAKIEADQVRNRATGRGMDARLVTGPSASADRVLSELAMVKYAHLATHGFFADPSFRSVFRLDPELFRFDRGGRERVGAGATNPLVMSGLVFAGANRADTPGRGVLTGEALLDRDLSGLELAVLSACETGLGDVADGQGVFGLQRAFHVAGCRNVVASLWKVDDDATAALMGEFYRRLWDEKNPLPPLEALRQAQLAVMRADRKDFRAMATRGVGKGDIKDPKLEPEVGPPMPGGKRNPTAYWAAFTLSGPGR